MPTVYSILENIGSAVESKTPVKMPLSTQVVGGVAALALCYTLRTVVGSVYTFIRRAVNDKKRQQKRETCRQGIDDLTARLERDPPPVSISVSSREYYNYVQFEKSPYIVYIYLILNVQTFARSNA